jgi:sugar-specific transcriptional regulator TrmB
MATTTPRRSKLLRCIPPAKVLRERLAETLNEAAQLRELLSTAERIEAVEQGLTPAHTAADRPEVNRD